MNRIFVPLLETEADFDTEFDRLFPPLSQLSGSEDSPVTGLGQGIENMMQMAGMAGFHKLSPEAFERFEEQQKVGRWRSVVVFTIFLPVMLTWSLFGPAIVGLAVVAAIVGFVIGLFTQQWLLVGICVYWWVGAKLSEAEMRFRGHY
ncbi:MAG: hypothetical protein U9N56_09225 [Actinomycetota bacterium]|nr:hypothetical protein [Actinomycetota bacterium]